MTVTDEQIAAYADGELTGEERARVEQAAASDPAIARKIEAHRALRSSLGAHYAPILDQPVPDHLAQLLATKKPSEESGKVVSFAAARQKRGLVPAMRRWAPLAGPAIAASLVLAVWQPWQGESAAPAYAGPQLASALESQLVAEQTAGAQTRILLSFESEAGAYCRAYRSNDSGGIACRDETGWQLREQFALGERQTGEFRQAGSEADLLAAAQAMAAGAALDAEAEEAARARGWR